jgi:hypothetical protein
MKPVKCLSVAAFAFGLAVAPLGSVLAQDVFIGSWVLDVASSTAAPGMMPTGSTLEITAADGGQYKSVSEVVMSVGTGRSEVTYSIDGKDYAVTATPVEPGAPAITQSIERVSDMVYKTSVKLGGQEVATALNEISGDRKTITVTTTGAGQYAVISSTMVFRRK